MSLTACRAKEKEVIMAKKKSVKTARINRDDYPSVDVLSALHEGKPSVMKRKLKSGFNKINKTLDELRLLDPESKEKMGAVIKTARENLSHIDHESHDTSMQRIARKFQATAKSMSELFETSLKGAGKFIDSSSDMSFLLSRYYQYRSALLNFVTLNDPIGIQKEMLDTGVLIYKDDEGKYYSCTAHTVPIDRLLSSPAITEDPEISDSKSFNSLARILYAGRAGILERRNVLLVKAVDGVDIKPKHVLAKASSLFRAGQKSVPVKKA